MKLEEAFEKLFDDSNYKPHPISLEGMEAYQKRIPKSKCPYTDPEKKKLWEHGWEVTDVGYFKSAEFSGGLYDDPEKWK